MRKSTSQFRPFVSSHPCFHRIPFPNRRGAEAWTVANTLPTYSEKGYGYAVEKAPRTKGWSYPVFEELWNYGYPQEMAHFARCVRGKEKPQTTGEDGLVVMKALYAGYASAGEGRKVQMPFNAQGIKRHIDLWFRGTRYRPPRKK